MKASPLLARSANAPIVWLHAEIPPLGLAAGPISGRQFLRQVTQLASVLPDKKFAINLCANRYLFLLSLCASIVRGQTSLLPPNKRRTAQLQLAQDYQDPYLLHDGVDELADLPKFNLFEQALDFSAELPTEHFSPPEIDAEFPALISFTSGSTGRSKPNIKSWRTLRESTAINARYMVPKVDQTYYHLATVPGQHMWGLETSVIMALFANVCVSDSQPFFPADIVDHLQQLPRPRALITTPLHLRSLRETQGASLELDNVLCATAPLSKALAQEIEHRFGTTLREVYGCSEVGSMSVRQTARDELWQAFEGLNFSQQAAKTIVTANHLPESTTLSDALEPVDNGYFRLQGRQSDLIKIAGKRGSLAEVNQAILDYPGVQDGVAFMPPQDKAVPRLTALVVWGEGNDTADQQKDGLRDHLRQRLDTAFVPRPILSVPSLPREENGKITQTRLLSYYDSIHN